VSRTVRNRRWAVVRCCGHGGGADASRRRPRCPGEPCGARRRPGSLAVTGRPRRRPCTPRRRWRPGREPDPPDAASPPHPSPLLNHHHRHSARRRHSFIARPDGQRRTRAALTGKHDTLVRRAPGWQGAPDGQQAKKIHPKSTASILPVYQQRDWGPGMVKCVGPTRCLLRPCAGLRRLQGSNCMGRYETVCSGVLGSIRGYTPYTNLRFFDSVYSPQ